MPQWEVRAADGRLVGRVDFGWPGLATVGEFDGRVEYGRLRNVERECVVGRAVTDRSSARSLLPEQQAAERRVAAQRASTELRVASLARQVDSIFESSSWTANDDEHDPEGATIAFERAQLLALLARARADLDDLDRAARRLHSGEYHRCEHCGERIGEQRLAALPATRTCIRCATAARR